MTSRDPLEEFEHDHVHLTKLVVELRDLIERVKRGEIRAKDTYPTFTLFLDQLREDLLHHFAREEEGLFPYLEANLPRSRDAVTEIVAAHDALCGSVSRMTHLARQGEPAFQAQFQAIAAIFARFEATYGDHARAERALLTSLGPELTAAQRAELAEAVRGL